MSELITRRTFLKTTGAAALAVAASGMLAGCGGAYASTPDGLVAAAVDSDKVVDFGAFTANIGRFDQWTSSSIYEGGERHNYLYAAFAVSTMSSTDSITINTSDLSLRTPAAARAPSWGLATRA